MSRGISPSIPLVAAISIMALYATNLAARWSTTMTRVGSSSVGRVVVVGMRMTSLVATESKWSSMGSGATTISGCECCSDEFDDTDGARNQGFNIISTLVHACLLEECSNSRFVKFHDVVRDMALWITSEMGEMKGKFLVQTSVGLTQAPDFVTWTTTERISLMNNRIEKLTGSPTCPNLSILLLDLNSDLQIISNEIKKLPIEMKNLVQLKILRLCTSKLSSIPRGLISNLLMMQVVGMYDCGLYDQVAKGSVESYGNESLVEELESLKYLTHLSVTIASASVFKRFLSSRKLPSCTLAICLKMFKGKGKEIVGYSSLNPNAKCFHGLCEVAINRCQMLKNLTWLIFAPNLQYLKIGQCDEIEEVIGKGVEDGGNLKMLKRLPLNSNSANQGRVVMVGKQEWWNELEWEDEATLTTFLPTRCHYPSGPRVTSLAAMRNQPRFLKLQKEWGRKGSCGRRPTEKVATEGVKQKRWRQKE
ncbi:Disease resistance protein RPS5 [Vitis vinifera]|uniref:Disease resistance protein RPS5 n=1 Tax=Vitis vinifera TaxID=29760 RepID=A0A438CEZ8_VITVI|nr:Disease resistance protein RPS5 [Vitis vinifera]